MLRKIKLPIPTDVTLEIQRLNYEMEARKNVLTRLIEANIDDPTFDEKPLFQTIHNRFVDANAKYDLAKEDFAARYLPKYLKDHRVRWSLDYATSELTIEVLCDCPIQELDQKEE
ncbi:MAG: hypothetical protein Q4C52_11940 [Eubacteriales bacterium]|nr:hypothetical protein [Eubacteriales bacterium]